MKTSNIIFVSLIASITLLITTGMMEFRIKGVPRGSVEHKRFEIKQVPVPEFHFVVVKDCNNISLEASDAFSIGITDKPAGVAKPAYRVTNDTLYVKGFSGDDIGDIVNIKAPAQQVKKIRVFNSWIIVYNLSLDQFAIHSDNAKVSIDNEQPINALTIEGVNNSRIEFFKPNTISILDLNLDHTEIYTSCTLGRLKGSIRNQSKVQLNNANELTFTKDGTSYLQVWGNQ
jgi:hypothetical protein